MTSHCYDIKKKRKDVLTMVNNQLRVCYFMGNITSHCDHAIPLFNHLGGEFITLSEDKKTEIEERGLPSKCVNDRPDLFLEFDRKIKPTVKYIEQNFDIVVFYELFDFSFFASIKKIPTVFLTHGNMLKTFMWPNRLKALRKYNYLAALSPFLKEKFISEHRIKAKKLLDLGIARNDEIVKSQGKTIFSDGFSNEVKLDASKRFVSYTPTWWGVSTVQSIGLDLIDNFPQEYNLLIRLHPQTPEKIIAKYRAKIAKLDNIQIIEDISIQEQLEASSLLIGDLSSVVLEWILTDKPLIFLYEQDADYRKNLESIRELVNYSLCINEQNMVDLPELLTKAINAGIDTEVWEKTKQHAFYGYRGDSAQSIVRCLNSLVVKM